MYKVLIKKPEKHPTLDCDMFSDFISIDAVKPYDITDSEWKVLCNAVQNLSFGEIDDSCHMIDDGCSYELIRLENNQDGNILAESEYYFIRGQYEDASIYYYA